LLDFYIFPVSSVGRALGC